MKKFWCKHFVALSRLEAVSRPAAAEWAFKRFGSTNVDIFYNDPNGTPGFYFSNEKDAILFALRWGT